METFQTADKTVSKFIHADGSETAIKTVLSQTTLRTDHGLETQLVDRQKYSIIASTSLGCFMKCPFCHLTSKNSQFKKISPYWILSNLKEAMEFEIKNRSEAFTDCYAKLCWMGMGDALLRHEDVIDMSVDLLDWIMENQYAVGLDTVDLSTVMPKGNSEWMYDFASLNDRLKQYPQNPNLTDGRSPFRLFYSLHSAIHKTREIMVPNAEPLVTAREKLLTYKNTGLSLVFHQLFVEGLNDSEKEVDEIIKFMKYGFEDCELRILRYNHCDRSEFKEWTAIDTAIKRIADCLPMVKVQSSAGAEIQAACGQFLVARPLYNLNA